MTKVIGLPQGASWRSVLGNAQLSFFHLLAATMESDRKRKRESFSVEKKREILADVVCFKVEYM